MRRGPARGRRDAVLNIHTMLAGHEPAPPLDPRASAGTRPLAAAQKSLQKLPFHPQQQWQPFVRHELPFEKDPDTRLETLVGIFDGPLHEWWGNKAAAELPTAELRASAAFADKSVGRYVRSAIDTLQSSASLVADLEDLPQGHLHTETMMVTLI